MPAGGALADGALDGVADDDALPHEAPACVTHGRHDDGQVTMSSTV